MFEKIIVIGSPGSGKSTFSAKLQEITALPLLHLDMIWHKPDKTNVTREEFDKNLNEILAGDRWIVDGNYQRTLSVRLEKCDTVFLLDYPLQVCLSGVEARIGKQRADMPWTEAEFDSEFKQCIIDFPIRKLPAIYNMLDNNKDKNIVIFKSREESDAYLNELAEIFNKRSVERR